VRGSWQPELAQSCLFFDVCGHSCYYHVVRLPGEQVYGSAPPLYAACSLMLWRGNDHTTQQMEGEQKLALRKHNF
jgi:hypothetical protein